MKWSIGFGLERIGIAVLRWPKIATLLLLVSLAFAVSTLPKLGFDGNVVNVLNTQSKTFKDFVRQATNFHDYSGDVVIIVEHEKFLTASVFEGLRNLHLDLSLEEGVESVYSVFTLGDGGEGESLLPPEFDDDASVQRALQKLLADEPATRSIIAPDKKAMMMMVRLQREDYASEQSIGSRLDALDKAVKSLAPEGTQFAFSGMPQIRVSIVEAIISDQTMLTSAGILLGWLVAWFIFGTFRSAIICTIPAAISVLWVLAAFAISGVKLNFFTTALPTLALIITFADTIVLHYRWQNLNGDAAYSGQIESLREAILQVGPASSLTSITTAIAFASFAWADSQTMDLLAIFGVAAVMFAFLGVIIGLPLAGYWSVRIFGDVAKSAAPRMASKGAWIATVTTAKPRLVFVVSIVLVGVFALAHADLKPSYTLSEYFPYQSDVRKAEAFADDTFGGTAQYYIVVPVTEGGSFNDTKNRQRLISVDRIVADVFGRDKTLSLAAAWNRMNESEIALLPEQLEQAAPSLRGRFLSKDQKLTQVAATTSTGESTLKVEKRIAELQARLNDLPFADEISVTGLRVLLSRSFPPLIEDLRTGLLVSIFLAMIFLAIATRSVGLALASLVPNLIPILFTEAVMWSIGASLSVTNVIALTIAFGIAIDNAVHVINAYNARGDVEDLAQRVRAAVSEISPALFSSTAIICVASIITQASSMPSVSELGLLLIATLIVALISNLAILPSAMIVILGNGKNAARQSRATSL